MNPTLQATLDLSKHTCLETVTGIYQHPFVRPTGVFQGYDFTPGSWAVELFNVKPKDLEVEDPGTRTAIIQYCPFCGACLYPAPPAPSATPAGETQEVSHGEKAPKGPVHPQAKGS